ncbi:MAG: 3-oxoacyl-ACP reductase family protein [Dehalococcoidia bacterium]|nr:3-oxoacyl-ACP reductase family protein [Dehalococcoidia bacterium]
MKLKDRVAIVTGSSAGIGRAIALAFGREGARVVVTGRDEKRTNAVAEEIRHLGASALPILMNLSREDDASNMVARTLAEFGRIDILVNNAAFRDVNKRGPFIECNMAEVEAEIVTTLVGTIRCCRVVIPHMIEQKSGRVINITSASSKEPPTTMHTYGACKAGIAAFSRSVALELAAQGITVNCVAPGPIKTPYMEQKFKERPELETEWSALVPMRRFGEPAEIAAMVVFLASDDARFITGQNYSVDGGRTW